MKLGLLMGTALVALAVSQPAVADQRFTFTYTGSIVKFTVPTTGTYQILAFGAQGGDSTDPRGGTGGLGAEISGDFSLTAGDVLQVAVGGAGVPGSGGGGGGGSFVVGPNNAPLLIAGGGGGGGSPCPIAPGAFCASNVSGGNGSAGRISETGDNGGGARGGAGGSAGNGGQGGSAASDLRQGLGGGGGGFFSAGGTVRLLLPGGSGGGAFPEFTGGSECPLIVPVSRAPVSGGFGGGGGDCRSGGGGGGFSGGGGGGGGGFGVAQVGGIPQFDPTGGGGGAGSFDSGSNQTLISGIQTGNGEVVITQRSPVFAGKPGEANCHGKSVSAVAKKFGGLNGAAMGLGFSDVSALQNAIMQFCGD